MIVCGRGRFFGMVTGGGGCPPDHVDQFVARLLTGATFLVGSGCEGGRCSAFSGKGT